MNEYPTNADGEGIKRRRLRAVAGGLALLGAGAVAGGLLATESVATAASTGSTAATAAASNTSSSATTPGLPAMPPGPRGPRPPKPVAGTVTAVGSSSVTIKSGSTTKTYSVTSKSDIDKNGEAKLSDLKAGDKVMFSPITVKGVATIAVLHAGNLALDGPPGPGGPGGGQCGPGGPGGPPPPGAKAPSSSSSSSSSTTGTAAA
ncbi:MAG TPA: hypothetical protein VGS21_09765 [Acidimicrobiales bacterium]|nr:hypothetical protein [Acidimicrobiales bacterium]